MSDIFTPRKNLRPYEYPDLYNYVDAVRHSYWIHSEFNYTSDVHDYKVNITDTEREAIKRTMLAISQIEVAVKNFWGDVYKRLPKPEIGAVGTTFAESEVRHADAYANLLEVIGLNDEFESLLDVPVMKERVDYLDQTLELSRSQSNEEYTKSIILFALLIEHVSLFSQFLVMMSFNKHKNLFKGISNAVEATSKEEQIHGMFGIDLINIIRNENPDWFGSETNKMIKEFCLEAYAVEEKVVDWIFAEGELDFLSSKSTKEFIKERLNNSLKLAGFEKPFEVDPAIVQETEWFDTEIIATKHGDFFQKRSINYNKKSKSITSSDLF